METKTTASNWLITGASSGFGKSIARAALDAGHRVIATTRDIAKAEESNPGLSAAGGKWVALDPAQKDAHEQFSRLSREHDIDVMVNSAGYAFIGGVEDTSEEEVREQLEVNFFGPLRAVRACLPGMREKGSGHIVLISSGAGFISRPGRGVYSASKYAIEAMHEALHHEASQLGIKVLIVCPGVFNTAFSSRLIFPRQYPSIGFSEPYKGTQLEMLVNMTRSLSSPPANMSIGDPDKAADEILKAVVGGHDYLRMIIGRDCIDAMEEKLAEFKRDLEATRAIGSSMEVD